MKLRFLTLTLPLFLASHALAETTVLTTDGAIAKALAENPQLRATRYQIAVAQANLKWSGKLDDPEFEMGANTDQWGLNDNEGIVEIALSQKFPLTDRLKRERNVSEVDLALAKAEVRVAEWHLASQVRTTAIDALTLQQRIQLHEQLRSVLTDLFEQIDRAFQEGEASQLDVTDAKLEVATLVKEIRTLEAELVVLNGQLRGLMGDSSEAQVGVTGHLSVPAHFQIQATDAVLARRPDMLLSSLQQRRAEASVELARSRRWQDIAVRLFLERETAEDAPEGLERNTFAGVGFSVPLPLRSPESRLTDVPRQQLAGAKASTEARSAVIRNEITTANEDIARRRIVWEQASGETLELARRNVREVREAWQLGKETFVRLQRAQERALGLEENAIEALHEYHQAKARLQKAAGLDATANLQAD